MSAYGYVILATTPVKRVLATVVMAARQIVTTSKGGGCPYCQPCTMAVAPEKQLLNSLIHHAVLEGGWPRWQYPNVAVARSYWGDATWRVS